MSGQLLIDQTIKSYGYIRREKNHDHLTIKQSNKQPYIQSHPSTNHAVDHLVTPFSNRSHSKVLNGHQLIVSLPELSSKHFVLLCDIFERAELTISQSNDTSITFLSVIDAHEHVSRTVNLSASDDARLYTALISINQQINQSNNQSNNQSKKGWWQTLYTILGHSIDRLNNESCEQSTSHCVPIDQIARRIESHIAELQHVINQSAKHSVEEVEVKQCDDYRSDDQTNNQSDEPLFTQSDQSVTDYDDDIQSLQFDDQSIDQSINGSVEPFINRSFDQTVIRHQSINQSYETINQSINRHKILKSAFYQWCDFVQSMRDQSVKLSVNHSINQIRRVWSHWRDRTINQRAIRFSQSVNQTIKQCAVDHWRDSINQSINQRLYQDLCQLRNRRLITQTFGQWVGLFQSHHSIELINQSNVDRLIDQFRVRDAFTIWHSEYRSINQSIDRAANLFDRSTIYSILAIIKWRKLVLPYQSNNQSNKQSNNQLCPFAARKYDQWLISNSVHQWKCITLKTKLARKLFQQYSINQSMKQALNKWHQYTRYQQSINQSSIQLQSTDQMRLINHAFAAWISVYQHKKLVDQSINQKQIEQSKQMQSVNQLADQFCHNQSIKRSIDQWHNHTHNRQNLLMATEYYRTIKLDQFINQWINQSNRQSIKQSMNIAADVLYVNRLRSLMLTAWKSQFLIKQSIKSINQRNQSRLLKRMFDTWRESINQSISERHEAAVAMARERMAEDQLLGQLIVRSRMKKILIDWYQESINQSISGSINQNHQAVLLVRSINQWRNQASQSIRLKNTLRQKWMRMINQSIHQSINQSINEEYVVYQVEQKLRVLKLRSTFNHWRSINQSINQSKQLAIQFHNQSMIARSINQWTNQLTISTNQSIEHDRLISQLQSNRARQLLIRSVNYWHNQSINRSINQSNMLLAKRFVVARFFSVWTQTTHINQIEQTAKQSINRSRFKRSIDLWHRRTIDQSVNQSNQSIAECHSNAMIATRALSNWINELEFARSLDQSVRQFQVNQSINQMKTCLSHWVIETKRSRRVKLIDQSVDQIIQKNVFIAWHQTIKQLNNQPINQLQRRFFVLWLFRTKRARMKRTINQSINQMINQQSHQQQNNF